MSANAARLAKIKKTLGPPPTKPLYLERPDWTAPDALPEGITVVHGDAYDTLWLREGDSVVGVDMIGIGEYRAPTRAEAEAHARQLLAGAKAKAPGSPAPRPRRSALYASLPAIEPRNPKALDRVPTPPVRPSGRGSHRAALLGRDLRFHRPAGRHLVPFPGVLEHVPPSVHHRTALAPPRRLPRRRRSHPRLPGGSGVPVASRQRGRYGVARIGVEYSHEIRRFHDDYS